MEQTPVEQNTFACKTQDHIITYHHNTDIKENDPLVLTDWFVSALFCNIATPFWNSSYIGVRKMWWSTELLTVQF